MTQEDTVMEETELGPCLTCGTICVGTALSARCPNYNCLSNVYDRIAQRRERHLALAQDDY
jgi:hypothetical protein